MKKVSLRHLMNRCAAAFFATSIALMASASARAAEEAAKAADQRVATAALYVVHLTKGKEWDSAKPANEQAGFREHSANLARLRSEGRLLVGARYQDAIADKGMLIFRATSREEVLAELARDPMIAQQRFAAEISDFRPFYQGYIPLLRAPAASTPPRPLSAFQWLVGCWAGGKGAVVTREHWMAESAGVMMAMARTLRGEKLISYEAIRLELDPDGTPTYVPKPSGQAEARFRLLSQSDGRVVFENKAHDFPQRIIYQRTPEGGLNARIEGEQNSKSRAIDFPMQRASCEE